MKKIKYYYSLFYKSLYYPLFVAFLVFISHMLCIELLAIVLIGISASIGLILCRDLKYILSPAIMIFFCLSKTNVYYKDGLFFSTPILTIVSIIAVVFIIALIAHFIIYRRNINFRSALKSPLFLGYITLSIGILFNGLFDKESFSMSNLGFTFLLIFSYIAVFYLFYVGIDFDSDFRKYLVYVLFISSLLVTAELYSIFLTGQVRFENGEIVKESIVTGWGIWNTMGCYLSMLLPVHFYLATFAKKYSFVFYLTGLISYFSIVLSLSRSSLLAGTFVMAISIIISCFKGENKLSNRIITGVLFLIGIAGIIILWDKIANIFGDYLARGFDDNGRFEIYEFGIKKFLKNPIFGGGFYNSYYYITDGLPFGYHNTIIQMMASCGALGLVGYLFHRYQTIKLIIKKRSTPNIFLFLCISALLITSLLDVHMISLYPAIYYNLILIAVEKSSNHNHQCNWWYAHP